MTLPASAAPRFVDAGVAAALERGESPRVIVELKDDGVRFDIAATRSRRDALKASVIARLPADAGSVRRRYSALPMLALTLKRQDALRVLQDDDRIEAIYPDKRRTAIGTQALPLIGQPAAVSAGYQGAGTAVAVLDTGVDYTRSQFGTCTAVATPAANCKVVAAYEAAVEDNAHDANGHGTRVAMTALAVAPQSSIVAIDVFEGDGAWDSDVIEGMDWAISQRATHNIAAINLSLGDGTQNAGACTLTPYVAAIRRARNAGIVVVVAAGNDSFTAGIAEPACVANALAVGATYDANVGQRAFSGCTDSSTAADKVTCYSNSGQPLDLFAPGSVLTIGGNTLDGTSFAAPMAAGAVAVLKQRFPLDTPAQLESRLTLSGTTITDARNGLQRPRLALGAAVAGVGTESNDAFAAARTLSGAAASDSGSNTLASSEPGEPAHDGTAATRSLWWTWTAPASGVLTLDTNGSSFDTLLAVYTGSALASLTLEGSDDDGGNGSQSKLDLIVAAGTTYRIAVDGFAGATGSVVLNLAFDERAEQTIVFPSPGDVWLDQGSVALEALASSGLTVTYASIAPATCNVSGSTATLIAAGTCSIVASQAGNGDWFAAPSVTLDFSIKPARGSQTVAFPPPATTALDAGPVALAASASSGLAVSYASLTPAVCTTSGSQASLIATGTCTVQASQPGNDAWLAATPLNASFVVTAPAAATASDGDVPLPGWALAGLAAALAGSVMRRRR
ncbi:S8 family peptidase [Methyloversatilis discipulorum]|uniref:S8 family peptidase n=1 Tax=Methyloversatilis discipulorum TaxID=1119528 RepID=UPI001A458207|nr:S8 family serine peptidase [Methyloversatilis discipulorum]MBL8468387.1 S8 family serine peptidase [Methyloversatilis discipulorum]